MFCVHPNSTETPVVFQDVNPAQTRSGKAIIVGGCPSRALGSTKIVNVRSKIFLQ